jgi:hypothetical protein
MSLRSNQMDPFLREIHRKLSEDPRVRSKRTAFVAGNAATSHLIKSCPCNGVCMIIFYDQGEFEGYGSVYRCWINFVNIAACPGECFSIFSDSLPPVKTFLQRRELADVLTAGKGAIGCLYCFGRTRKVSRMDTMCAGCHRAHCREENRLVKKMMIVRCFLGGVLGEDCAGVVAGYLLYFFAGK